MKAREASNSSLIANADERRSLRSFKAHLHAIIDRERPVLLTRKGVPVGAYVPLDKDLNPTYEPQEREDPTQPEPYDDDDGPTELIVARITADAGPTFRVIQAIEDLGLQGLFGDD